MQRHVRTSVNLSFLWFTCRSGQGDTDYHGSNGQADTHSLHSSHLSVQEDPLLIRTHKQQTSQQVRPTTPLIFPTRNFVRDLFRKFTHLSLSPSYKSGSQSIERHWRIFKNSFLYLLYLLLFIRFFNNFYEISNFYIIIFYYIYIFM